MKLLNASAILVLLLTPAAARANDPMAGWLQQQAMAYQRARTGKGAIPRPTGNLLRPRAVILKQAKPTTEKATTKQASTEKQTAEKQASTEKQTAEKQAGTEKQVSTEKKQTSTEKQAIEKQIGTEKQAEHGAAYALGKMVRRMVQVLERAKAKPEASPKKVASPKLAVALSHRFEPLARPIQRASNPSSLFLLRQARLISLADFQAGLAQFLGTR